MDFNLGVLETIVVQSTCTAAWTAMRGSDSVRHCQACDRNVYNLSGMPRQEAEALLNGYEGRLCVRILRHRDGTVVTGDKTLGRRRFLSRVYYGFAALLAMVGLPSCVHQSLGAIDIRRKSPSESEPVHAVEHSKIEGNRELH